MTSNNRPPARGLSLLYLRQISSNLLIYQPVFIPFLLSRGLNMLDVALLQTAYNLGVLALDIPSGFFAVRFGRKWALALCNVSLVIGTTLIAIGHSLTVFIIAELFYAIAIALDSTVHSAYLFEWLRGQRRESEYYRYDAFGTFLVLVIGAIGTLVAGYFAEQNLATPVIMTIALTAIGIPAACFLPSQKQPAGKAAADAPVQRVRKTELLLEDLSGIGRIVKSLLFRPELRWALGITVVWFWARQYINFIISQPYFHSIGLELRHFGVLYSILTLSSGVIALASRRWIQRPDLRAITGLGVILIPLSFGLMAFVPGRAGLAGFFLFAIPYGLCTAVTNTLLNRQFNEHSERATFLSIVDFFVRLVASGLAILLGWILARDGASAALVAATAFSGALGLWLLRGTLRFAGGPRRAQRILGKSEPISS